MSAAGITLLQWPTRPQWRSFVSAGAAVAVFGPMITARATTEGQKRKFDHEEHQADRRELRTVLDEVMVKIAETETSVRELNSVYVEGGAAQARDAGALAEAGKSLQQLGLAQLRLAIRRGDNDPTTVACGEVIEHAATDLNAINGHAMLPKTTDPPGHRAFEEEIREIEAATSRFVAAAKEWVEAKVERTTQP